MENIYLVSHDESVIAAVKQLISSKPDWQVEVIKANQLENQKTRAEAYRDAIAIIIDMLNISEEKDLLRFEKITGKIKREIGNEGCPLYGLIPKGVHHIEDYISINKNTDNLFPYPFTQINQRVTDKQIQEIIVDAIETGVQHYEAQKGYKKTNDTAKTLALPRLLYDEIKQLKTVNLEEVADYFCACLERYYEDYNFDIFIYYKGKQVRTKSYSIFKAFIETILEKEDMTTDLLSKSNSLIDNSEEHEVLNELRGKYSIVFVSLNLFGLDLGYMVFYVKTKDASPLKLKSSSSNIGFIQYCTLFTCFALYETLSEEKLMERKSDCLDVLNKVIETRDGYTNEHSKRVAKFCKIIGQELGLDSDDMEMLSYAARYHDIGKIGMSDEVLKSDIKVDTDNPITDHPSHGARIMEKLLNRTNDSSIIKSILHHHENFDGTGYPTNLRGDAIPYFARIIRVADSFDAMTSRRAYKVKRKAALSAINEIKSLKKTHYDPKIVDAFSHAFTREPNTILKLIPNSE